MKMVEHAAFSAPALVEIAVFQWVSKALSEALLEVVITFLFDGRERWCRGHR